MKLFFRWMARFLFAKENRSGLASIGSFKDVTVSKFARISYAAHLQKVFGLSEEVSTL